MHPRLNKLKNKSLTYFLIFIFLVLFLSSLVPIVKEPSLNILKFPFSLLSSLRREFGGMIFYHRHLVQHEGLKKEINLLRQRLNAVNEIYLENIRLKELLAFKQKSPYRLMGARVIGRSPDNWSTTVIIDKGRDSGIKRGMAAISYLGLLGRVVEATGSTSKVMLINDPNFAVSSIVQRSRQEGLVSGTLGGSLIMRYLPGNADIKVSDVVITSGLTGAYPKGLLVGTVVEVNEEFSGLTRYALIRPAVNLSNIEEVLIIIQ